MYVRDAERGWRICPQPDHVSRLRLSQHLLRSVESEGPAKPMSRPIPRTGFVPTFLSRGVTVSPCRLFTTTALLLGVALFAGRDTLPRYDL